MREPKTVVIVGSAGQDGRLLAKHLGRCGRSVIGIKRPGPASSTADPIVSHLELDILDFRQVNAQVASLRPCQIYYLAAFHHASEDRPPDTLDLYQRSHDVHVKGLLHFLDAILKKSPQTRLFYASSSHVFGSPTMVPQDESTPLAPCCIYGITKAAGMQCCRFYRESGGIYASTGILYTHESGFRPRTFLAAKIVDAAIEISRGERESLVVGDLSAEIDWGCAPDYVDAMTRILALPCPDDFVIATGRLISVRSFIAIVFERMGLHWQKHVKEDPSIIFRGRRGALLGNPSKLHRATGWTPSADPNALADYLLRARGADL